MGRLEALHLLLAEQQMVVVGNAQLLQQAYRQLAIGADVAGDGDAMQPHRWWQAGGCHG